MRSKFELHPQQNRSISKIPILPILKHNCKYELLKNNIRFKNRKENLRTNITNRKSVMNPYNMKYTIGNDLKEHPDDVIAFQKGIDYLKQKLKQEKDVTEQARLLSKIGVHQRIAGQLKESYQYLLEARKILEHSEHSRLYIINEIRIAQTFQFLKQYSKAIDCYQHIEIFITKYPSCSNLLHYVYQHKGKTYFDQEFYLLAKENIEKALAIRKEMGNDDLIQSSTFALDVIDQKISK